MERISQQIPTNKKKVMNAKILITFLTGILLTFALEGQQLVDNNPRLLKLFEANTKKWKDAYI